MTSYERFMRKISVDPTTGCWNWTAGKGRKGYGQFKAGRSWAAHRWSYEHHVGPIPEGLQIDHLCRNTSCVNPEHLEPVTARENVLRSEGIGAVRARQTHCVHGHEFTPDNTYVRSNGTRKCKPCQVDVNTANAIKRSKARLESRIARGLPPDPRMLAIKDAA